MVSKMVKLKKLKLDLTVIAGLIVFANPKWLLSSGAVTTEELDAISTVSEETGERKLTPQADELPYMELWHRLALYFYHDIEPLPEEEARLAELGAMTDGKLTKAGAVLAEEACKSMRSLYELWHNT